jgi:hypothetical protein
MNSIRLVLMLVVALLAGFRLANAQCDRYSDSKVRFDQMRVLPPSKIFWDGRTITATFKEGAEILQTDKDSVLHIPTDYKDKTFWIIYDSCSRYIYVLDEVLPKQVKK